MQDNSAFKETVKRFKDGVAMMKQKIEFDNKSAKQKSISMPVIPTFRRMQPFPFQKLQKALQDKQKALEKPCTNYTWY